MTCTKFTPILIDNVCLGTVATRTYGDAETGEREPRVRLAINDALYTRTIPDIWQASGEEWRRPAASLADSVCLGT